MSERSATSDEPLFRVRCDPVVARDLQSLIVAAGHTRVLVEGVTWMRNDERAGIHGEGPGPDGWRLPLLHIAASWRDVPELLTVRITAHE
jgi:hypothetical protein